MENQAYYIQKLLVDELDNCKEQGSKYTEGYIREIQDTYKQDNQKMKKLIENNKRQAQEEEIFLYKPYDIASSRPKTPKSTFIQDEIDNLEKYMKYIQSSVMLGVVYTRDKSPQSGLRDVRAYGMTLASAYVLYYLSVTQLQLQKRGRSPRQK